MLSANVFPRHPSSYLEIPGAARCGARGTYLCIDIMRVHGSSAVLFAATNRSPSFRVAHPPQRKVLFPVCLGKWPNDEIIGISMDGPFWGFVMFGWSAGDIQNDYLPQ